MTFFLARLDGECDLHGKYEYKVLILAETLEEAEAVADFLTEDTSEIISMIRTDEPEKTYEVLEVPFAASDGRGVLITPIYEPAKYIYDSGRLQA